MNETDAIEALTMLAGLYLNDDEGARLSEKLANADPASDIAPLLYTLSVQIGGFRREAQERVHIYDREFQEIRKLEDSFCRRLFNCKAAGRHDMAADTEKDLKEAREATCDAEAGMVEAKLESINADNEAQIFENALSSLPDPYKGTGEFILEEFYRDFPWEIKAYASPQEP